jgi:serine/threonine protein kinase
MVRQVPYEPNPADEIVTSAYLVEALRLSQDSSTLSFQWPFIRGAFLTGPRTAHTIRTVTIGELRPHQGDARWWNVDSLLPGGNLGRYRVVELIGRGGIAVVFKACDPERGRHVAIKVLPTYQADEAAFVERFRWEVQAVTQLNHLNIVRVYDFGEDKGFTYIVMEHLDGGTLLERMESRLPKDAVLAYIRPVAGALEYAHGRGIVHRDVKPGNILLDDEGKPILCDFGLARMLEESAAASGTGTVMGPPSTWPRRRPSGASLTTVRTSTPSRSSSTRCCLAGRRFGPARPPSYPR